MQGRHLLGQQVAKTQNSNSQKPERLQELLKSVWGVITPTPQLCALLYQLLAALAGTAIQTLRDQKKAGTEDGEGVLIVHVFHTNFDGLEEVGQQSPGFGRVCSRIAQRDHPGERHQT